VSDFEVMPIGTKDALLEAARTFRAYERVHRIRLERANDAGRAGLAHARKAARNADMAGRLEGLAR
jgi:hypothetical protein